MGKLAKTYSNIVGVKDATGRIERVSEQFATCGVDFIQLSGEDASALGYNAQGGAGCISVSANVAPRLCAEFQRACLDGDFTQARTINARLMPLHKALFIEPNPAGVKYVAEKIGLCRADLRLPLVGIEPATARIIDAALEHAGIDKVA